jgi:hypothetical protein
LANIYLCRYGNNKVTEDPEIGFPPSGDTDQHDAPC